MASPQSRGPTEEGAFAETVQDPDVVNPGREEQGSIMIWTVVVWRRS
jgi:hypothetical protein